MIRIRKTLIGMFLGSIVACLASCITEDAVQTPDAGKTTVLLRIGSRVSGALAEDGVQTLRVALVQDGKVVAYSVQEESPDNVLTFVGLERKETQIYAVANADDVSLAAEETIYLAAAIDEDLQAGDLSAALSSYMLGSPFPKAEDSEAQSEDEPLPMFGEASIDLTNVADGATEEVTVWMKRAVARLTITINNQSGDELNLQNIVFGECLAQETPLKEPETITAECADGELPANATIADEGRASFTYYVYEAPATATYTIALGANPSWEAITVPQNFMENAKTTDGTPVDHIARNMDIRITGTVESSGQPLELKVLVNPWLEEEVEVPPYQ